MRRTFALLLVGAGIYLAAGPLVRRVFAAPTPRTGTQPPRVHAHRPRLPASRPNRVEVTQDDLVKLTVQSEDVAYSFTIDEYRVSKRVPAGGSTTIEFRADRAGTFAFYSNLTNDARHSQMRGAAGRAVAEPRSSLSRSGPASIATEP